MQYNVQFVQPPFLRQNHASILSKVRSSDSSVVYVFSRFDFKRKYRNDTSGLSTVLRKL